MATPRFLGAPVKVPSWHLAESSGEFPAHKRSKKGARKRNSGGAFAGRRLPPSQVTSANVLQSLLKSLIFRLLFWLVLSRASSCRAASTKICCFLGKIAMSITCLVFFGKSAPFASGLRMNSSTFVAVIASSLSFRHRLQMSWRKPSWCMCLNFHECRHLGLFPKELALSILLCSWAIFRPRCISLQTSLNSLCNLSGLTSTRR